MTGPDRRPFTATIIRQEIEERGYILLKTYCDAASGEEVASALWKAHTPEKGSPVHQLTPTSDDKITPNTYSGIYGLRARKIETQAALSKIGVHALNRITAFRWPRFIRTK